MKKLHLVGVNLTRDGLIFTDRRGADAESFLVPVDAALAALVADLVGDAVVQGSGAPVDVGARSESSLSVREIQARLRSGRSVDEIAEAAGVSTGWVERFAPPVRAEQHQIISRARAATYERARLGPSVEPLGRAVAHHLTAKGVRLTPQEFDQRWSTHHRIDHRWIVQHEYTLRGRRHIGTWEFDAETGVLEAADRRSLDLGYLSPDQKVARIDAEPDSTEPRPTPRGDAPTAAEARPAKRPAPPSPPAEPDDGWADALEWLADNDEPRSRPARPQRLDLFSMIDDAPDVVEPPRLLTESDDWSTDDLPEPPEWVASTAEPEPEPEVEPRPDPLGFLSDDAVQAPARINAERVPLPQPSDDSVGAEPRPEREDTEHDPAAPDRPTPHRPPGSTHRRNRPLRAR